MAGIWIEILLVRLSAIDGDTFLLKTFMTLGMESLGGGNAT